MFTKGQKVTVLGHWSDADMSSYYRDAVVYSCGKKQMVLTDALTGEEIGRNFKPQVEQYQSQQVLPRMETLEAYAAAVAHSSAYCAQRIQQLKDTHARPTFAQQAEGWRNAMTEELTRLQGLLAAGAEYNDLLAAVKAVRK